MNAINLKDAYYHGLAGEEVSFMMYPESALYITLSKLEGILKYKGILSREKQKGIGINNLEFNVHLNFSDTNIINNYVSVCKKLESNNDGSAYEAFVEGKISIALPYDLYKKYKFRNKQEYSPDNGEEQIRDFIDISDFTAILIDIENNTYKQIAIKRIIELIKKYNVLDLPIIESNGNILIKNINDMELDSNCLNKKQETNMCTAFKLMTLDEELPDFFVNSMSEKALKQLNMPTQITPKQFLDYINNSECRNIFYNYLMTQEHEIFYQVDDHDIKHSDDVTMFAYYIASKEGYKGSNLQILLEAARYHDIGLMDSTPKNHGIAGANKYIKMCKSKLSPSHQKVVAFLIQTHNMENLDNIRKFANSLFPNYNKQLIDVLCDMSNIVRDADALDRTRFPIFSFDYLNSKLLTHASAIELIEVAQTINYRQAFRPARKCMEDNTKVLKLDDNEGR